MNRCLSNPKGLRGLLPKEHEPWGTGAFRFRPSLARSTLARFALCPGPVMASEGFRGLRVLSLESRRAREMAQLIANHGGRATVAPSTREVPSGPNAEES